MRWEFWLRAIGPHVVLAAATSGVCHLIGRHPWFAFVLTAVQLAVWYWTDLLLTGRVKGARLVRESAEYLDADGKKTTDHEINAWTLLAVIFLSSNLIHLAAGRGLWTGVCLLCVDLPILVFAIFWSDAFSAFERHVYPRLERQRQIDDARYEVRRFYDLHPELHDVYPRVLLRSALKSVMPDTADPTACWRACRRLLKTLHALAAEARAALSAEEEHRRRGEPPPAHDHRETGGAALSAVLNELRMGLPPEAIARSLEESLGDAPAPPRARAPDAHP